uniref:Uncharacterized protein n=1 Tax=Arundo donax TaxID=35708 RepID=A0A0A9FHX6_ARUDO
MPPSSPSTALPSASRIWLRRRWRSSRRMRSWSLGSTASCLSARACSRWTSPGPSTIR